MSEKIKYEQVEKLFSNKGYTIIGEYINSTTPVLCSKNGYRYKISYANLKYGKNPSLWGFSNIDNLEYNINVVLKKKQSQSVFLGYEIIQKKSKKRILLYFKCSCGNEFCKTLEDSVYKVYIDCNSCQVKKRGRNKRLGLKAIEYVKEQGYKVISAPEVCRNSDLIEVEDKNGFRGFVTYSKLKSGKRMSLFDIRINKKNYIYNVNRLAEISGSKVQCVGFSNKKYSRQALKFRCECGNEFITSISNFQNGKIQCNECTKSISHYEKIFKNFLEKQNIEYIYQYSLNQCRDILPLPFDFYIVKEGILVEIDGEGHYHPCNFNQISNKQSILSFESTKKHDEIKNNFCYENNIPLLRIPYFAFKDESYKQLFLAFRQRVANSD